MGWRRRIAPTTTSSADAYPRSFRLNQRKGMAIHSIIVVDDDLDTLNAMQQVLEPVGYAVMAATSGREALGLLNRKPADLLITDILMPDMDGFELIAAMRRTFPRMRIIAISGGRDLNPVSRETYLVIARGFGVDAVLQKPINRDELVTAIKGIENRPWTPPPLG
jgi:CheY-like chemotaxis protein